MRFSIVTITKNNPLGFAKTKKSVYAQTFLNYEWIVIDGEVEPDNGIYDAMNKGIMRAKGDYVIFMNAGDMFADDQTLSRIVEHNADFIYGDAIEEGGFIKPAKHHSEIKYGMLTHHQSMVYKTEILKKLQYDERYSIAADYKLTLQFINLSHSIKYIKSPLCIFGNGGISQANTALARRQEIQIRKELGISAPLTPYRQWAAQMIKKYYPKLFWWWKGR